MNFGWLRIELPWNSKAHSLSLVLTSFSQFHVVLFQFRLGPDDHRPQYTAADRYLYGSQSWPTADIIRPPSAPEDLTQVIISGSPSAGVCCYGLASPLFATVFSL